jgi:hypothetical protein
MTLVAEDIDSGLSGEKTITFQFERYDSNLVVSNSSRNCDVEVPNQYTDRIGAGAMPGYITTDNVDGSAARTSEVNSTANPTELAEVVSRISGTTPAEETEIRHIAPADGSNYSWDCVETAITEGGITLVQTRIEDNS